MEAAMIDRTKTVIIVVRWHIIIFIMKYGLYTLNITPHTAKILQHKFSTQKERGYESCFTTLAPKTKTYSKSAYFITRVLLCSAT